MEGLSCSSSCHWRGAATGRFPARNMAAFGFTCFASAFYYTSTHFTLTMTFGFASWLRVLQMFSIPFCFIAITTAAYVGLPKEASNQVSGIINFVRNVGGSIFIAATGAVVTNRSLFHQAHLQEYMQPGQSCLRQQSQHAYIILRRERKRARPGPDGASRALSGSE